jgi:hypothetical protein
VGIQNGKTDWITVIDFIYWIPACAGMTQIKDKRIMELSQTESNNDSQSKRSINWGIAILVLAIIVWLLEKLCLRISVAVHSPSLAFVTFITFIAIDVSLVIGGLYILIAGKRFKKQPAYWGAVIATLWSSVRLAIMLYYFILNL